MPRLSSQPKTKKKPSRRTVRATRRRTTTTTKRKTKESPISPWDLNERIAKKAYEIFEQRGYIHGFDQNDWLEAENFIKKEMTARR